MVKDGHRGGRWRRACLQEISAIGNGSVQMAQVQMAQICLVGSSWSHALQGNW